MFRFYVVEYVRHSASAVGGLPHLASSTKPHLDYSDSKEGKGEPPEIESELLADVVRCNGRVSAIPAARERGHAQLWAHRKNCRSCVVARTAALFPSRRRDPRKLRCRQVKDLSARASSNRCMPTLRRLTEPFPRTHSYFGWTWRWDRQRCTWSQVPRKIRD